MRGRVIYASKDRVKQDAITYEELADPKWKGKICSRSGQHVYNTSLLATIIAHKGEAAAEAWAKGFKDNLAQKPAGGDREQVRDVQSGKCDLAIGNTYYMALMMTNAKNPEQKDWAAAVKLLFPNASDRGTHVNVSGMALTKHAPNKDNAHQADGIPGLRRGAEDLLAAEQRVPGQCAREPSDIVRASAS